MNQCTAKTLSGSQCKNTSRTGKTVCYIHDDLDMSHHVSSDLSLTAYSRFRPFSQPYNLVVYFISATLLFIGLLTGSLIPLYIAWGIFTIWDVGYLIDTKSSHGRDATNMLSETTVARQHISYFLPFYGVLLAYLLRKMLQNKPLLLHCYIELEFHHG